MVHCTEPPIDILLKASEFLKWAILGSLLVGWVELVEEKASASMKRTWWTLLDLALLALTTMSFTSVILKILIRFLSSDQFTTGWDKMHRKDVADIGLAVALVFVLGVVFIRKIKGNPASGYVCVVLGFFFIAAAVDTLELHHQITNNKMTISDMSFQEHEVITSVIITVLALGSFLLSGLQDNQTTSTTHQQGAQLISEDNRSPFGVMACVTIYRNFKIALTSPKYIEEHIPILSKRLRCAPVVKRFNEILCRKTFTWGGRGGPIIFSVFSVIWKDVLWMAVVTIAYFICLISRVPVLESLIAGDDSSLTGTYAFLFIATCVAESCLSYYQLHLSLRCGVQIRNMLQTTMFRKMTRLSPTSRALSSSGHLVSVIGVDCQQCSLATVYLPLPVLGLICMPFMFAMLAERVGRVPVICCAAWMVLAVLMPLPISRLQMTLWRKILSSRDQRLKRMADLLTSVRLVKMCAWEDAYMDSVKGFRESEVDSVFRVNLLDGLIDSLYSGTSSMMIILLFGSLAIFDPNRHLSPALSFSCIYMLSLTDTITNNLSQVFRIRCLMSLALERIISFCTQEEDEGKQIGFNYRSQTKGTIVMENCSFGWTKHQTNSTLTSISLHLAPRSLVGVSGLIGTGKTALLAAILGDMHCMKGDVKITGRIAYTPQVADIFNMTIRDNIVFGSKFDDIRYDQVLNACELIQDMRTLPAGDMTQVSERGETLSGGQKQRIALARAAYSRSDIYLLDDPFSALDSKVAENVFEKVLGERGILRQKTRILVTNKASLLRNVDQLLLMHDNKITYYPNATQLIAPHRHSKSCKTRMTQMTPNTPSVSRDTMQANGPKEKLTVNEVTTSSKSTLDVAWSLVRLYGVYAPLALLLFLGSGVALAWQLIWIKKWTDADVQGESGGHGWERGLVFLCFFDVIFRSVGGLLLAVGSRKLSVHLHNEMLSHVLLSPVSFFDTNPRGRILNRFAVDLEAVDARLYLFGKQLIQATLLTVAKLIAAGSQAPLIMIVGSGALVTFGIGMMLILRAANMARFLETTRFSRTLQHVTESLESLSSLRSYGVVERFCNHFCHLTDYHLKPYATFLAYYRFSRTLGNLCGFAVVLASILFMLWNLSGGDSASSSGLGLALSASLSIPQTIVSLNLVIFIGPQLLVCFERGLQYTELPEEDDTKQGRGSKDFKLKDGKHIDNNWPTHGRVEFENYCASYRPGVLSNVLKGITLLIEPCQKVGVVGRTGAGKSSLVLALLRILKTTSGNIHIDGIDIGTVPLRRLRSSLTVIPQNPYLVRGTLRSNLDPTGIHNDDDLWKALEQAHLSEFVSAHPDKLLLETGDGGASLSVGQRQLVSLARALLRRPKVLILDEATAQMDSNTDSLVQATLRSSFADCTVITVAHRIHTILDYDMVIVMADGVVQEFGPVTQLLSNPNSAFSHMAGSDDMTHS